MEGIQNKRSNDRSNINIQEKVNVAGMNTLNGDVICLKLNVAGMVKVNGNIEVMEKAEVAGVANFEKDFIASECNISGKAKIHGRSQVGDIHIAGMCTCLDGLEGKKINVAGTLKVNGDTACDAFYGEGTVNIDGLLSGDDISINFHQRISIKEIGGKNITIKRNERELFSLLQYLNGKPQLCTELIEGDQINIEHTDAGTIRGEDITIGEGCEVNFVEYKSKLNVHPNAKVKKVLKVE
ncbi:hypothetical protein [Vallitalea okinawensis]|uniref:hypothetical protein n=1 Tax=Vallitalea okinawensis TaxID=2078660 RepID=UPI000CFCC563|nr:hypothetical protein [Vallitalea okinawensis]